MGLHRADANRAGYRNWRHAFFTVVTDTTGDNLVYENNETNSKHMNNNAKEPLTDISSNAKIQRTLHYGHFDLSRYSSLSLNDSSSSISPAYTIGDRVSADDDQHRLKYIAAS